jgi:hypothetical protein
MTFKPALIKFHRIISQFGLDPLRFIRSFASLPAFLRDYRKFRAGYLGDIKFNPCLHDRFEEGGTTKSEYFWQDLIVARWIHDAKPNKHVDVGSRVDGFVAHVASFREIEVLDVRPISTQIPGITFKQANLMSPESISTLIAGGGTATRFRACMCSSILALVATATLSIRRGTLEVWRIWPHCSSLKDDFICRPQWGVNALNLTPIGSLLLKRSCHLRHPINCNHYGSWYSRQRKAWWISRSKQSSNQCTKWPRLITSWGLSNSSNAVIKSHDRRDYSPSCQAFCIADTSNPNEVLA